MSSSTEQSASRPHPLAGIEEAKPSVALVNMPFFQCLTPPIGLGILKAALTSHALPSTIYNLNLEVLPELDERAEEALQLYATINDGRRASVGEWIFAPPDSERDERYLARLPDRGFTPEELDLFVRLRSRVDDFVRRWARRVVAGGHDIVGLSASFERTRACVRLAEEIKQLAPDTRVLLGGYSTSGDMGCALLEAFGAIDLVCHTEADELIVPLVRAVRSEPGLSLESLRGISYRRGEHIVEQRHGASLPVMEHSPLPDYHDYLEQVRALGEKMGGKLDLPRWFPVESARGCWWGERRHCTFCGLNGDRLSFRSKSAERVLRDVEALHTEHGAKHFHLVDNVLNNAYFDTLLPRLAEQRRGFLFQWNVRPNLNRAELATLQRAGVRGLQPGTESLSTPVLHLMRKGSTAIDNIQMLKWSQAFGIGTGWSILFSFPGERLEWYEDLARAIPRLMHLPPPESLSRIAVHRFSPLFTHASHFGVRLLGPNLFTCMAFSDLPAELVERLAYDFSYEIEGRPARLDNRIRALLDPLIAQWREHFEEHGCTLSLIDGADEALLVEGPLLRPERIHRIQGLLLRLLRGCESVRPLRLVLQRLAADRLPDPDGEAPLTTRAFRELIAELSSSKARPQDGPEVTPSDAIDVAEERGWIYREADRLLSLPVNQTLFVKSKVFQFQAALRRYEQ